MGSVLGAAWRRILALHPLAWAAAGVLAANLWVGTRLEPLLQDTSVGELVVLDHKLRAFPRDQVQVLVLGNSHALAGLRPPDLAQAWGLPADAVFSLAVPGSSPDEMALLYARYAPSFPRLRLVLCGVEAYFLGGHHLQRTRYLTSMRPVARFETTERYQPEARLLAMAGVMLPVLDFGPPLHEAARTHPLLTTRALFKDVPMLNPNWLVLRDAAYRWGYPPPWDLRTERELRRHAVRTRERILFRERVRGLHQGEASIRFGARRLLAFAGAVQGPRLVLAELPYPQATAAELERLQPGHRTWWRSLIARGGGLTLIDPPDLDLAAFYDIDHLSREGASKMARHLAARIAP